MKEKKALNELLIRIFGNGEIPRKQAHIVLTGYNKKTVYRVVNEAIGNGYVESLKTSRQDNRDISYLKITKAGQDYLRQKSLLTPELIEKHKRLSVTGEKKRRIERISSLPA